MWSTLDGLRITLSECLAPTISKDHNRWQIQDLFRRGLDGAPVRGINSVLAELTSQAKLRGRFLGQKTGKQFDLFHTVVNGRKYFLVTERCCCNRSYWLVAVRAGSLDNPVDLFAEHSGKAKVKWSGPFHVGDNIKHNFGGVYIIERKIGKATWKPVYVGESGNIHGRIQEHLKSMLKVLHPNEIRYRVGDMTGQSKKKRMMVEQVLIRRGNGDFRTKKTSLEKDRALRNKSSIHPLFAKGAITISNRGKVPDHLRLLIPKNPIKVAKGKLAEYEWMG